MFDEIAEMMGMPVEEVEATYNNMFNSEKEWIVVGAAPNAEACAQLIMNKPEILFDFHKRNRFECNLLIEQMARTTLKDFKYIDNIGIYKNDYEDSYYEEVVYYFEVDSDEEAHLTIVEDALPEYWDNISKEKLQTFLNKNNL